MQPVGFPSSSRLHDEFEGQQIVWPDAAGPQVDNDWSHVPVKIGFDEGAGADSAAAVITAHMLFKQLTAAENVTKPNPLEDFSPLKIATMTGDFRSGSSGNVNAICSLFTSTLISCPLSAPEPWSLKETT